MRRLWLTLLSSPVALTSDEVKNYITPPATAPAGRAGRLRQVDRPAVVTTVSWAAGNGDRSENGDYIYGKRSFARSIVAFVT